MRYGLERFTALLPMLGGCSLIFNESRIPEPPTDAREIDAEVIIDADPSMLRLTAVQGTLILEGQGDEESRKALVVVAGDNISDLATMTITGGNITPGAVIRAVNHKFIAMEVSAPVDTLITGVDVPLTITVQQPDGLGGMITKTIPDAVITEGVKLRTLPELVLSAATHTTTAPTVLYSRISLPGPPATPPVMITLSGPERAEFHAVASITLPNLLATGASASGATTGGATLGSCLGGSGGSPGGCSLNGGGGAGMNNGIGSGGGGGGGGSTNGSSGSGTLVGGGGTATGDPLLVVWPGMMAGLNRANGGGGGGFPIGGSGGAGGGGGGAIKITSGGKLRVGTVTLTGGSGGSGNALLSSGGGGGAGGSLLVRAGGSLMVGMVSAKGGAGGMVPSANNGGIGGEGRLRWDAPVSSPPPSDVAVRRGPSFATTTPLVFGTTNAMITVVGPPNEDFSHYTVHNGMDVPGADHRFDGSGSFNLAVILRGGLNKVCVHLAGALPRSTEAEVCIDVAFLPL